MCEQCDKAETVVSEAIDNFTVQQKHGLKLIVNAGTLATLRASATDPENYPFVDVRPVVDKLTGKTVPALCLFTPVEGEENTQDVVLLGVVVAGDADASNRYEPLPGIDMHDVEQEASGQ